MMRHMTHTPGDLAEIDTTEREFDTMMAHGTPATALSATVGDAAAERLADYPEPLRSQGLAQLAATVRTARAEHPERYPALTGAAGDHARRAFCTRRLTPSPSA